MADNEVNDDDWRAPLDLEAVHMHLRNAPVPWHSIEVADETGSTNTDLIRAADDGVDITRVVRVGEHQTAGRGRQGRSWLTPPRSQLAFSFGVAVGDVPQDRWGWLPLLVGVAVVDTVDAVCGVDAGLKWPNDVLANGGKVAGILAEVTGPKPIVVVGIGLNVTVSRDEAPEPATSLLTLGARSVDRNRILACLLVELTKRIDEWIASAGSDACLIADYRQRSLTLGTRVRVALPGDRNIIGHAVDVDSLGMLHIDTGNDVVKVAAGDVTHLRSEHA